MTPALDDQIEGCRVRERRAWLGLTHEWIGVDAPTLSRIEQGECPAEGWGSIRARLLVELEQHVDPARHWHTQIAGPWTAAEWRDAWLTRTATEET